MDVALTTSSGSLFQNVMTHWLKNADRATVLLLWTGILYFGALKLCIVSTFKQQRAGEAG